jgi:hypothetical protein
LSSKPHPEPPKKSFSYLVYQEIQRQSGSRVNLVFYGAVKYLGSFCPSTVVCSVFWLDCHIHKMAAADPGIIPHIGASIERGEFFLFCALLENTPL